MNTTKLGEVRLSRRSNVFFVVSDVAEISRKHYGYEMVYDDGSASYPLTAEQAKQHAKWARDHCGEGCSCAPPKEFYG